VHCNTLQHIEPVALCHHGISLFKNLPQSIISPSILLAYTVNGISDVKIAFIIAEKEIM